MFFKLLAPSIWPGKVSGFTTEREKEYTMKAKLNDKNLEALESGASKVDADLGFATPATLLLKDEAPAGIKQELPSLAKLKDLLKTVKRAHLT